MKKEDVITLLNKPELKFLRVLWCDNANVIRSKAINTALVADNFDHPVGISMAQQSVPVMFDIPSNGSGLGPVGEIQLKPAWNTLGILHHLPSQASVIGDMYYQGSHWDCCPRNYLKKAIAEAKKHGIHINSAFENEFYLLKPTGDDTKPGIFDDSLFAMASSMDINAKVIDQIAESLTHYGMTVERYYPESGPGQHEISIKYDNALKSADNQVIYRQIVNGVAQMNGLTASFMPKIFEESAGSGCHAHISLADDGGRNIFGDPSQKHGISENARRFMAGVLKHLHALCAATIPTVNSYRRIKPHCWSGAFDCWGFDNREAAIRVITGPDGKTVSHMELKTVDASANPYVAMASIIFAGMDGIANKMELPEPVQVDPGSLDAQKLSELGIKRLPKILAESLAELDKDEVLKNGMGANFYKAYAAVKKTEWNYMSTFTLDRERQLLLRRY